MQFSSLTDAFTLANGVRVPCIGFGTWQSEDGDEAYNAVTAALQSGYRHIDTAAAYGNEKSVARQSGISAGNTTCAARTFS